MKLLLWALAGALAAATPAAAQAFGDDYRHPPPAGYERDARCAMGCAHYHWEMAGRFDGLYGAGYGYGYESSWDHGYSYERESSYDRYGRAHGGSAYGGHDEQPAPSYPRPDYGYDGGYDYPPPQPYEGPYYDGERG